MWVAYRTIEQAHASNQWIVRTQEVLTPSEMRAEENRLLVERVQVNPRTVRRLQQVLVALVVAATGLVGRIIWITAINVRRHTYAVLAPWCDS